MKRKYSFSGIYLLIFILLAGHGLLFGQQSNQYLSFTQGFQQHTDHINTLPMRETFNGGEEFYRIDFSFTGATISAVMVEDTEYEYLNIDGFGKMGQVGAPALPARREVIAMPPGSAGDIVITASEYFEYDGFRIHPTLEPARDTYGSPEPEFWADPAVYGNNAFFPEKTVEITNIMLLRGNPLALTEIRPVQFNPVTGKVRVYTSISFRIDYKGASKPFGAIADGNSLHFTNLLKRNVINSDNIPDGMIRGNSKAGEKEYIIITHSQYINEANQLANWKRQLGYSVEVVSQSSWTAAQVKTAIETRYDTWNPKPDYFLILGDHTGSFAVPGDVINTPYSPPDDGPFATDLYFACMDGSTDWHPDMAHGRISVSTVAEAQVVVNKIINYEKTPPTQSSFYSNILNCAQYQDDDNNGYADRRFCHTSENIRDYLQGEYSYTSSRVYFTSSTANVTSLRYNNGFYSTGQLLPSELRSTSFNWAGGATDITNGINAGKFMVFHRDHGYVGGSGWHRPYYTTTSMESLSNGSLLPVVFSINCHTGEFQLDNCFAEKLMRMSNKGAVGVIGAAYFSLSGWNDAISIGMIDAIWATPGVYPVFGSGGTGANYTIGDGNEIYTMGDVMNQGLYAMEQNWNGASTYDKYSYELFHYFGDPAMKMWTENPNNNVITATHSSTIQCSGTLFAITGSEPDATATLVYNDELIGEIVLNGSGSGNIPYAITQTGSTVTLTISKTNHKPYTANLSITGACNFPPAVTTNAASGIGQTTATLNGEITNDWGYTVTGSGFVYSTTSSPVIGGTGVTQIQTSPVVGSGAFALQASGLAPGTTYYYRAYAVSAGGTGYGNDQVLTTNCGVISTLPYAQDFSTGDLPNCWANIDNQGNGQVWAFVDPVPRTFNSTSNANGYAILDSDLYGSGNTQNADLVTPEFDLSGYISVNLYFEHYFRSYSGSSGTLAYSINGGSSWTTIQTWTATTNNAVVFNQDMTAQVAGESSVMFKWNYTGTWGYYWMVDDVSITGVEAAEANQLINLSAGWNMMSFCVVPASMDMMNIVQPLVDGSTLVKVSDESGGFIQYIVGSWMNTIGDMANTEGYYINLSGSDDLVIEGTAITYPFDIPLSAGWNIMGYPVDVSQDAMTVLQNIIDDGYLVKVIDEAGGIIQYINGIGWVNTIINFEPDEGYYINVNTNCTLTHTEPAKGEEPFVRPVPAKNEYFTFLPTNPYMPMNIIISQIETQGFEAGIGDEIAVFDGNTEVGSLVVEDVSKNHYLITARADDPLSSEKDGFEAGNMISFRYWDKDAGQVYEAQATGVLSGNDNYLPLGTFATGLKISSLGTGEAASSGVNFLGQNFPNPYTDQTSIEFGIAGDAHVFLGIYDVYGRLAAVVSNSDLQKGKHLVNIDGATLDPGMYYYRIEATGQKFSFSAVKKMILH